MKTPMRPTMIPQCWTKIVYAGTHSRFCTFSTANRGKNAFSPANAVPAPPMISTGLMVTSMNFCIEISLQIRGAEPGRAGPGSAAVVRCVTRM